MAISAVNDDSPINGSEGSIVEDISLFHTTVRSSLTREIATFSNGALAQSRIINLRRSDKAQISINVKFGVDVPHDKIVLFRKAVETFVQDRPQEFVGTLGFRISRVESDLGFIEYVIVLQSREGWQSIGTVLESKAKVSCFCIEVQKQIGALFVAPPMPVNSNVDNSSRNKQDYDEAMKNPTRDCNIAEAFVANSSGRRESLVFSLKSDASMDEDEHHGTVFEMERRFESKKSK
jgi:small-conductance mechanosensitive channel